MSTAHDFPCRINSTATTVSGELLITGILKAGTVTIDANTPITFAGPINFDSPLKCRSFTADFGTVAYFNSAVRNWTPNNISSLGPVGSLINRPLVAWYDASDESTITTGAGNVVTALADKASTGPYNLTAVAGGSEPTTRTHTIKGKNVINLNTDDHLDSGATIQTGDPGGRSGNMIISMVGEVTDPIPASASTSILSMDGGNDWQLQCGSAISSFPQEFGGQLLGLGAPTTVPAAVTSVHPGPSVFSVMLDDQDVLGGGSIKELFIDGVSQGSGATTVLGNPSRLLIFTNRAMNTEPVGNFGELVASFDVRATATIEGYLAWKWGLQANLPGNHAFKKNPPQV